MGTGSGLAARQGRASSAGRSKQPLSSTSCTIGSITVKGGLYGTILSDSTIGSIAAGSYGATLDTSGAIGKIGIDGDVLSGSRIRTGKAIDRLIITGDLQEGAVIDAQSIGVLRIGGHRAGTITTHA